MSESYPESPMLSKSCQYALRALVFISVHSTPTRLVGAQEIADALDIPKHFLSKIMQQLTRNRMVSSTKGPNGGFWLSEENTGITVDRVVEVMDGPGLFTACVLGLPECSGVNPCPLHAQAVDLRDGLHKKLQRLTLRELAIVVRKGNIHV